MSSPSRDGGGQWSPADRLFREGLQGIIRQIPPQESFMWIGFDHHLAMSTSGEMAYPIAKALVIFWRDQMCFKAVGYVGERRNNLKRLTVLQVGSGAVYSLTYESPSGRIRWIEPDPFDTTHLRQLLD